LYLDVELQVLRDAAEAAVRLFKVFLSGLF